MIRQRHVDLRAWHSLAAPALADELCILQAPEELAEALPGDYVLGGGSNIVFLPEVPQRLIRLDWQGWDVQERGDAVEITAQAGTNWQELVAFCCEQGWYGLENLAAIPGTVGAAPVQNIGAYGVEIAEKIKHLKLYHRREKRFVQWSAAEALFAYRSSRLKREPDWLVVSVTLNLNKKGSIVRGHAALESAAAAHPWQQMQTVMAVRAQRLPDWRQEPNAGSFFHNPIVDGEQLAALRKRFPELVYFGHGERYKIAAAWCIEHCGFKGVQDGRVGISERHALVLVNRGGSGTEILRFARRIQAEVKALFGLDLSIEPAIVGRDAA